MLGFLKIELRVYVPISANKKNITLMFDIHKINADNLSAKDFMKLDSNFINEAHYSINYSDPYAYSRETKPVRYAYTIKLDRKLSKDDITQSKVDLMHGFKLTWQYNTTNVESYAKFYSKHNGINVQFTRRVFSICLSLSSSKSIHI